MVDRFGVPDIMFGDVPEDFYGLVGRIALVSTLLEDRVLGLLWALDDKPQPTHAGCPSSQLDEEIRSRLSLHSGALGDELVAEAESMLDQVGAAFDERHALVHSLWPNPTLEFAQGWRSKRVPKRDGGGSEIVWTKTSAVQLQACLDELVRLTDVVLALANRVWGARGRM